MCLCVYVSEKRNTDNEMYICTSLVLSSSVECISLNYPLWMHRETWVLVAQCCATKSKNISDNALWSTLASYELKETLQSKTAGVESCPITIWCTGWLWDLVADLCYFSCRCRPAITTIVTWWSQISLQMENALRVEKLSKSRFLNNRLEKERWESEDLNVLRNQNFYNFALSYSVIALPAEETVTTMHWNRTEMKLRYIWEFICKHVRCNQKLSLFGFAQFKQVQNVDAKLLLNWC